MEIINLHKIKGDAKSNAKTGSKVESKIGAKAGAKTASNTPRSGYHFFLREQLEKMTGEDQKNYCSFLSRMWKKIREDLFIHMQQ